VEVILEPLSDKKSLFHYIYLLHQNLSWNPSKKAQNESFGECNSGLLGYLLVYALLNDVLCYVCVTNKECVTK
jgi:hypothetical protein